MIICFPADQCFSLCKPLHLEVFDCRLLVRGSNWKGPCTAGSASHLSQCSFHTLLAEIGSMGVGFRYCLGGVFVAAFAGADGDGDLGAIAPNSC